MQRSYRYDQAALSALLDGRDLHGEPTAIEAAQRYGAVVPRPAALAQPVKAEDA